MGKIAQAVQATLRMADALVTYASFFKFEPTWARTFQEWYQARQEDKE